MPWLPVTASSFVVLGHSLLGFGEPALGATPIGLSLVGGLARLVGILAGLACLGVVLYLYLGHSYALHPNGQSRSDLILLCGIAANERLHVEGCQD